MFGSAKSIAVLGVAVLPLALAACSGSAGMESTDTELGAEDFGFEGTGSTEHRTAPRETTSDETLARVIVERSDNLDGAESGQALAHFVQLVSGSERSLELVGLDRKLPNVAAGDSLCRTDFSVADAAVDRAVELELLDAGSVEIRTNRADAVESEAVESEAVESEAVESVVALAPHAFPSVSSFASGLVYTTRDRSAGALPSDAHYQVVISGARSVPRLEVAGSAPSELSQVTLGGVPLAQIRGIDAKAPLDVTWQVGRPGDIVYVELAGSVDGETRLVCAFPDEAGSGTISAEVLDGARGAVRFSIHRVRAVMGTATATLPAAPTPGGHALGPGQLGPGQLGPGQTPRLRTELRFDFDLSRTLLVGDELFIGDDGSVEDAAEPSLTEPSLTEPSLAEPSPAEPSLTEPAGIDPVMPVEGDGQAHESLDPDETLGFGEGTEGVSGATGEIKVADPPPADALPSNGATPSGGFAPERAQENPEAARAVKVAAERVAAGSELAAEAAPYENVAPSTGESASEVELQARPAP